MCMDSLLFSITWVTDWRYSSHKLCVLLVPCASTVSAVIYSQRPNWTAWVRSWRRSDALKKTKNARCGEFAFAFCCLYRETFVVFNFRLIHTLFSLLSAFRCCFSLHIVPICSKLFLCEIFNFDKLGRARSKAEKQHQQPKPSYQRAMPFNYYMGSYGYGATNVPTRR